MDKKKYERPSMEMVLLNEPLLMSGSSNAKGSAGFSSDYKPIFQDMV